MYCLRWWLPLFLLPFPKTTPFFLVLFLFSFALHPKPCVYCALILLGLFTTSSSWYSLPASPHAHPATPAAADAGTGSWFPVVPSTAPTVVTASDASSPLQHGTTPCQPPRTSWGWLDLGNHGGNGFWAPLSRASSYHDIPTRPTHHPQDVAATVKLPRPLVRALAKLGHHVPPQLTIPARIYVGFGRASGAGFYLSLVPGAASSTSASHPPADLST
ncbi:hypothetical protein ACQY0O_002188 [Thecaphora frezii]